MIQERIAAGLPLGIDEVAGQHFVSVRTLQRGLADEGTDFGTVRRETQVNVAIELMCHGASAARAARDVRLSRDHLCVLVNQRTGLRPRQIVRSYALAQRAARWKSRVPPRYGTKLYVKRMYEWRRIDAELRQLLDGLEADHPLATWVTQLRRQARRPDYRRRRYRARVRTARKREAAEAERQQRAVKAWFKAWSGMSADAIWPPTPTTRTSNAP